MSIIFAIILFSFLIFIHELGHFTFAKAFGVQVNEFSLFMGPAIWKKQQGETLYAVCCIPIGGYCAMEGEDGDSENPRAFSNAVWWKRFIILVAGALMLRHHCSTHKSTTYLPNYRIFVAAVIHSVLQCTIVQGFACCCG